VICRARELEPARLEDDVGIRALLRSSPMPGRIRLTLEREPAFDPAISAGADRTHTFVHRDPATGRILGLAQRSVSRVWLDGRPRLLGYLTLLRCAPELRITAELLRAGFAACESTRREDELSFDLTSILEENVRARRLLERGLPGLPVYRRLCRFVTLTLDVGSALRRCGGHRASELEIRRACAGDARALAGFLADAQARHPLSDVWTEQDLLVEGRRWNLAPEDFHLALRAGVIAGCLALWDQRPFKQTVVRGYSPGLALARTFFNPVAGVLGRARLPSAGTVLPMAFLSHLALQPEEPELLVELVRAALLSARSRRIRYVVIGLAEQHPLLPVLRERFRGHELASLLYLVHPAGIALADGVGPGVPHPEVARL